MKNYRSMNADQMSAQMREMAELAPTPDLQECYQHAAALLSVAQGESQPVAWCGWHPKHGYALQTIGHDQQYCSSLLMRTDIAGNHGWSCQPLYAGAMTEGMRASLPAGAREIIARAIHSRRYQLDAKDTASMFAWYAADPKGTDASRMAIFRSYQDADAAISALAAFSSTDRGNAA